MITITQVITHGRTKYIININGVIVVLRTLLLVNNLANAAEVPVYWHLVPNTRPIEFRDYVRATDSLPIEARISMQHSLDHVHYNKGPEALPLSY